MKRMIVGCGYLGRRVGLAWLGRGDEVHALTRSTARAENLAREGFTPLVGDVTHPSTLPALGAVDTLLWAVGYDRLSGKAIGDVYVQGLAHLLDVASVETGRVIYISSTGVYGQQDGSWVDESTPCQPTREGGRACLAAEDILLSSRWSSKAAILRLAGIYGPGRLPRLRQLQVGQPIRSDPKATINLIHVEDAARAVLQAAALPLSLPRIFVIADGHPVERREFYEELSRQLHAPTPIFENDPADGPVADRSGGFKRVSNRRMLEELGLKLRFPTYRQGLAAIAVESTG